MGTYELVGADERQTWALEDDGTCAIRDASGAAPAGAACEWVYEEKGFLATVRVTVTRADAGGGGRQATTYLLTPRRWPGQPVTMALTSRVSLRKVE